MGGGPGPPVPSLEDLHRLWEDNLCLIMVKPL